MVLLLGKFCLLCLLNQEVELLLDDVNFHLMPSAAHLVRY